MTLSSADFNMRYQFSKGLGLFAMTFALLADFLLANEDKLEGQERQARFKYRSLRFLFGFEL